MSRASSYALGVDIGGTFTDFVVVGDDSSVRVHKTLTTPHDPTIGLLAGLDDLLDGAGLGAADLDAVVHSTTLVTNAIIERKGASVGLLVTRGFADQLELGTEQRYDIHDMRLTYPPPLVDRALRRDVDERTLSDGRPIVALNHEQVVAAAEELLAAGAHALAVAFLHAYRSPAHEEQAHAWLRERFPELPISISSRVAPIIGEYERTTTTTADAYVKPLVDGYLARLSDGLADRGFRGALYVVLSSGAAGGLDTARGYPVRLVESGPAAGAVAAAAYGRRLDLADLIAFDMGGTTAKACLIENGAPTVADRLEVARVHRFKSGSGLPLVVPSVELIEIGAGGGSIARVDALGLLKVGPDSAGADPGPACYAAGGVDPTVTDADLVLGYLDPGYFLGGRMRLDRERAERAVDALGAQLGLGRAETAWGIRQVVDENMAQAARAHLIEKNRDPRSMVLVAFGGAGPVHARSVARRLGIARVVCPLGAGATSALGGLAAPLAFSVARSYQARLDRMDWSALGALLEGMEREARAAFASSGRDPADATIERQAEIRLAGQLHEVSVRIPSGRLGPGDADRVRAAFRDEYLHRYGRFNDEHAVECVAWRVTASAPPPALSMPRSSARGTADEALKGERLAFFGTSARSVVANVDAGHTRGRASDRDGFVPTRVYDRYRLGPGALLDGPAVVEERESTVILAPSDRGRIDDDWNLWIEVAGTQ